MKYKIVILAALFLAGTAFLFFDVTRNKNPEKGPVAPPFEVNDAVTGKKLSSSNLKDKIIFVHFWASW